MAALPNIHPGEILREEYLEPLGRTAYWLARQVRMTPTAISEILKGRRRITAETALRFSRLFRTSPEFWLNLQAAYDLEEARTRMEGVLAEITPCIDPVAESEGKAAA